MNQPMKCSIKGLGAIGPGFTSWEEFKAGVVVGSEFGEETPAPAPESISKRERARAPHLVKLAVVAAEQACAESGYAPSELASVFSSCMSDTEVTDYMCRTLAVNPSEMSPTKFHNSVHNAAAGYWTISNKAHMPATAISAKREFSGAMALLEAITQCVEEQVPVLTVIYDIVVPDVLKCIMDIQEPAAFAFVLSPEDGAEGIDLLAELTSPNAQATQASESGASSAVTSSNPAYQLYPLFQGIAKDQRLDLSLPLGDKQFISLRSA